MQDWGKCDQKRQPQSLVGRETVAKVSVLKHKTAFKGKLRQGYLTDRKFWNFSAFKMCMCV